MEINIPAQRFSVMIFAAMFSVLAIGQGAPTTAQLNAAHFPGSDIGAQVNAAIAELPTIQVHTANSDNVAYPYGTIEIPATNSIQKFATQIGKGGKLLLALVTIKCDAGAMLQYTGDATDWIYALDPNGINSGTGPTGGVLDCTFTGPGNGTHILHFGNNQSYRVRDVFQNMNAPAASAVFVENTNYYTERYDFSGSKFFNNTNAITLSKNCGSNANCTHSFEHGVLHYYCATAYSMVGTCLNLTGGAAAQYEGVDINFNLANGNGASGSAAINLDHTSVFQQNVGSIAGENQTGALGYMLHSAGGYAELNNMHTFCARCTGTQVGAIDVPVAALGAFGGFPANANFLTYSVGQVIYFANLSCRNVTGGTCQSPPTIEVLKGNAAVGSLSCSAAKDTLTQTTLKGNGYPGDTVNVIVSGAGASCTAPTFSVVLGTRAN